MVTLVKTAVEVPQLSRPPPLVSAALPLMVLLIRVNVPPSLSIAPPWPPPAALLPVRVLLLIVRLPRL